MLTGLAAWRADDLAGTAATAAGPHAGGSPGQKINRLSFDGTGTMDFVIHRHAEIAFVFSLRPSAMWWLARRREAPSDVQRPLTGLCVLLALQGAVGMDQYYTHLPTQLVWVHVAISCAAWLAVLLVACAAGALSPSGSSTRPDEAPQGTVCAVACARFPANSGLFRRSNGPFSPSPS